MGGILNFIIIINKNIIVMAFSGPFRNDRVWLLFFKEIYGDQSGEYNVCR